jgi:ribosomal-protein-alanine N-acetyltransferase
MAHSFVSSHNREIELAAAGPNLILRFATAADAPRFYALASSPEVTRFFSWSYEAPADAEAWIAGLPAKRESGELLDFAIEHREHGVIGSTGFAEHSPRDRRAVIGTWLGHEHWGSGANREAKALACALAFGPLGLERVGAYAATGNLRSQRALERLGFTREGELREYHRHADGVYDLAVFGLLRREWEASPLYDVPATVSGEPPAVWSPAPR